MDSDNYVLTQEGTLDDSGITGDTLVNDIMHSGIKGMKWGVRRYQNKDGTLTPAGKKRRQANYLSEAKGMTDEELRSKVARMNLEKRYYNLSKNQSSKLTEKLDRAEKMTSKLSNMHGASRNINKAAGKIKDDTPDPTGKKLEIASKSISAAKKVNRITQESQLVKRNKAKLESMSDFDLREMVNRMDMEQQYSNLRKESVSRGRVTIQDTLDIAGDVLAIGASAAVLAVQIQKLRNG